MNERRYDGIQHLRALAVLLVVLCHLEMTLARPQYLGVEIAGGWFTAGAIGVDLFFVVSGFIMFHTTGGLQVDPARAGRFIVNRAIRILPFMWGCVLLYMAIAFALHGRSTDALPYLRSLSLFPVGELAPWEVWSLRHEMLFYAVVACALLGAGGRAVLGVFILGAIVSGWWIDRGPVDHVQSWVAVLWSPRANLAFGAGLLVGFVLEQRPVSSRKVDQRLLQGLLLCSPVALLALGVAYPATVVGEPLPAGQASDLHRALLMLPVLAALVLAAAFIEPVRSRAGRLSVAIGDASYSIYLTHVLFITAVAKAAAFAPMQHRGWLLVAIGVAGALLGGWLVHRHIERPMIDAIRRRYKARAGTGGVESARQV